MAEIVFVLDMSKAVGERLAPELIAEIQAVAPSLVTDGSVTTAKLDTKAVTADKIADGAVGSPQIAAKGVKTVNLDDAAVGTAQLADNGVTAAKAGTGVVTAVDATDTAVELTIKYMTATEYAGITPDPNVEYHIKAG